MKTTTKKAEPKTATASTAKEEAPVTETPVKEEVKTAGTATAKTATAKAKTTAAKKPAAKKATVAKKTTAAKRTATRKKAAPETNTEVYIQFWGREVYAKDVVERIKEVWANEMGKKPEELLDLKVYIKPEENGAHYVINGEITGFVSL